MFSWRTIAGGLLALLLFEALLRQLTLGHVTLDPRVGWMWRSTVVVHRLDEGWGVSHWREDETRSHPPVVANSPRVLFVGDSFTESLQVDDDEVFSARMPGIDALNIGQSGHSAAHYVDLAPEYRARYRPQWTVIELSPPDLAEEAFDPARTHFDSELRVTRVVAQSHPGRFFSLLEPLRRYSDAVDYAIARQNAYREAARMPPLFRAADADARPKAPPVTPAAWPVAAEISHLRAAYDGRVTFFFLSPPIDAPVTPVERTFMATCSAEGLSCVNMRTTYDDFRRRGDAPFGFPNSKFGEGHMNVRGHAAAAALLATELERLRERGLF